MVWVTITGEGVTTATRYKGDVLNKLFDMFNAVDILDSVKINSAVTWEFVDDAFRIRNPGDTFNYIFTPSAITGDRILTLPLMTTNEEIVTTQASQSVIKNKNIDTSNSVVDDADNTKKVILDLDGATTGKILTLDFNHTDDRTITFPNATDTLMGKATSDIMINKSYDCNGTGNVLTNVGDAEIETHTSTKITITNKLQLNTEIVYNDQTNSYQDFAQLFKDNILHINNPADTFKYIITAGAITADRILNIPVTTATDTLATLGVNQTFTGANTFSGANIFTGGNTFSTVISVFRNNMLGIRNPADTFNYIISSSAITADRTLTLPLITGSDTLPTLGLSQTFTGVNTMSGLNIINHANTGLTIRNPANTFNYTLIGAAITAARNLTLPLSTAADTLTSVGVANAWGVVNQNIASTGKWQEAGVSISPIGVHDYWIDATQIFPSTTNGSAPIATREIASGFDIRSLNFDETISESAQFDIVLPRSYNNGTLTFEVYWTAASGTGTVTWSIKAVSISNGVVINTAYGSAVAVTDTLIAVNDNHISPTSAALTIAATPIDGDYLKFQISRDITDTLNADAELLGVYVHYTTDAAVDA